VIADEHQTRVPAPCEHLPRAGHQVVEEPQVRFFDAVEK
jgi:hypothetical protein